MKIKFNHKMPHGAGIIILREFDGRKKLLGLVGPKILQKKHFGKFDIPKGCVDPGETFIECAQRECREEVGYTTDDYQILFGPWSGKRLKLWLACTKKDPVIQINPKINAPEHLGFHWLDPEELLANCYTFLKPGLQWAVDKLQTT